MKPVIDPTIPYLFDVIGKLSNLTLAISIASICTSIAVAIFYLCLLSDNYSDAESLTRFKHMLRQATIISVISTTMVIFIPSKDVMLQMLVLKQITPDNITATTTSAKELIDYVIEAINKLDTEKGANQ